MKLLTPLSALALALILAASSHAATPSAVQAQLTAQPTLRADTQTTPLTVTGQNLTVYGGAFFHRNYTDTAAYPTPQYVAALLDSSGNVVAQFVLAADGSHRAGLGSSNPTGDDGQTVSQITAQSDSIQTFVWTLPIASGSYTLVSTSLELPDANNVVLAAQAEGVACAPTATSPSSNGTMMAASLSVTGQPPQTPSVATQTGVTITAGSTFVFSGTGGFYTFSAGPNPPTNVSFSPFRVDLYTAAGAFVATYTADANGNFACSMGSTAGSSFTPNTGGGGLGAQWTISSGLAAGTYTVKVTTGQNVGVDPSTGSTTVCVVTGGGTATGVNASGLTVNYSTTTPSAYVSATPASHMKGMTSTISTSAVYASSTVLTGSPGSGITTIVNPPSTVQATTSVVGNVTYTLTAYGTVNGLSWSHLQGFDQIKLYGGIYSDSANNNDVSTAFSVSNVTLGTTYYLVYRQSSSGLTLTSNSVTPTTSAAKSRSVTTIPPVASTPSNATIKTNPSDIGTTVGNTVTFTGRTEGFPPPTVQWQISTDGGSSWSNLNSGGPYVVNSAPGSDTTTGWNDTTLKVQNATLAMNGYKFRFTGTNADGSATSRPAALTVSTVTPGSGTDVPAMPPLALGGLAAALLAAGYKFLPKKRRD